MNYILSTCGTSILTNISNSAERALLNKHANEKAPKDIDAEDRAKLENILAAAEERLLASTVKEAKALSAEIAAIALFYGNQFSSGRGDHHELLSTDTWLGEQTAHMVKAWLEQQGLQASVYRHPGLVTSDWHSFSSSLSDLVKWCEEYVKPRNCDRRHPTTKAQKVKWCEEYVKPRKVPGNNVVFNLSGGFKAEAGFLQVLGMVYADETIYTFERSDELLRIPQFPIRIVAREKIERDLRDVRRGFYNLAVTEKSQSLLWDTVDDEAALSPWGTMIFNAHKADIYEKAILDTISDNVMFGPQFHASCEGLSAERIRQINTQIDHLCRERETNQKLSGLDYKTLRNATPQGSTHEFDAWHDGDAKRVFCHEENGVVILDRLDKALH